MSDGFTINILLRQDRVNGLQIVEYVSDWKGAEPVVYLDGQIFDGTYEEALEKARREARP